MTVRFYLKRYKHNFFNYNYTLFFIILVIGLSTSEFLMGFSTISIFFNWILEGNFNLKIKKLKVNKYLLIFITIGYLSSFLWLFNSSNFQYAFNDLKVKIPILIIPLVLGSINLSNKQIINIYRFFVLGLLFSSFISLLVLLEIIETNKDLSDIRNISIFISHIRLSLLVCFGIVVLLVFYKKKMLFGYVFSIIALSWFIIFLFILQSVTGFFVLFIISLALIIILLLKNKKIKLKLGVILLFITLISLVYYKVTDIYNKQFVAPKVEVSDLDKTTKYGEIYQHVLEDNWLENGNRVWQYIAPKELEEYWNKRSNIPFDSLDLKGQPIWGTLYRYLTSKNLRKDREGLSKLDDIEIKKIENGITNCCETLTGLDKKIKEIIFEYERFKREQNPNGHSFVQRVIYLDASYNILKNNLILGVGLGDIHDEFMSYYAKNNSLLELKNRKRVHNQYMSFAVCFGIIGLLIWCFSVYSPLYYIKRNNKIIYIFFIIIISGSFLTDNTLERQAGVMFFAFFNSLILFHNLYLNNVKKKQIL